jgi:hypothetical protein
MFEKIYQKIICNNFMETKIHIVLDQSKNELNLHFVFFLKMELFLL